MGKITFNERAFITDFQRIMGTALREAGMTAMSIMTKNIMSLPAHDFKGDFKTEVASKINMALEQETDTCMKLLVGLIDDQSDEWFMIRAKILEYGMGSLADPAGGSDLEPVSHVQGVAGINDTVTGYAPVSNKPTYLLPDSWNHPPGHWFEDSVTMCREIFEEYIERAWEQINLGDYFKIEGKWTLNWTFM